MSMPTAPIREEHRELRPYIEQLRIVADGVGDMNVAALRTQVAETYEFLATHLIPHAQAEDEVLYPVVARLIGAPSSTATMSRDHVAVVHLVDELNAAQRGLAREVVSDELADEVRRILYGLYALVRTHFEKEEEIYLPLLDERLSPSEAAELFAGMEVSARRAKDLLAAPA